MTDTPPANRATSNKAAHTAPNVSGGWIVMILAFLVAVAVYFYLTQQQKQEFAVAVAATNIGAGEQVSAQDFKSVQVNLPKAQLDKLLMFDEVSKVDGYVTTTALSSGDPVLDSALRATSATDGLRAMSIPVDKNRAAGGALAIGDRIDVIDVNNQGSPFVARNLQVLGVDAGSTGGLGGSNQFSVTVAVSTSDIAPISRAINEKKFDIVRSTGATPLTTDN